VSDKTIKNLLAAWGSLQQEQDSSTLLGLSKILKGFPDDPYQTEEHLERGLASLIPKVSTAIWDTQCEMQKLPAHSPLLDLYGSSCRAYKEAEDALLLLESSLSDLSHGTLLHFSILLDEAIEQIVTSQSQWKGWLETDEPRCACCGYRNRREVRCPDCRVDLLVADRRDPTHLDSQKAVLGAVYVKAYRNYLELQDGHTSLEVLLDSMQPIQQNALKWQSLMRACNNKSDSSFKITSVLEGAVNDTLTGIALIKHAQHSRQWRDINDGWKFVFRAAVNVQCQLPALYRMVGAEEAAQRLEQDLRLRDTA
jgi:hypothetical protein